MREQLQRLQENVTAELLQVKTLEEVNELQSQILR